MNILIPMAGAGSRFEQAGYTFPKPLIEVHGKPMIQKVVENLNIEGRYIFIVQKEHYDKYALNYLLPLIAPGCEIVQVDGVTEGAACTTLLAKQFIDNDAPLITANSDQYIEFEDGWQRHLDTEWTDGNILTFEATHPKWSFARVDADGDVKYAEQMIEKDIRVNNEFYVCPVFNEAIADDKKIRTVPVKRMWGLGTPEDLRTYLSDYKG
jgi:dTDP-glucose pyrophosphorylase